MNMKKLTVKNAMKQFLSGLLYALYVFVTNLKRRPSNVYSLLHPKNEEEESIA